MNKTVALNFDTSIDGHVHTSLCHHAKGKMEDYVQAAIKKRLKEIVFLEHLEKGISYFETTWLSNEDFAFYQHEGNRLKEKYREKIKVSIGLEVGYNPNKSLELRDFVERYTWDRIGISYHFLAINGRFVNVVSRKKTNLALMEEIGLDEVIEKYYAGLHDAVEFLEGDVVCHLDAVLRHHPRINKLQDHAGKIRPVLDAIAAKKMAIEVNTSGFSIRGEPFPCRRWLREAVKRNIPFAVGSDAHRPEDVGRYFERLTNYTL